MAHKYSYTFTTDKGRLLQYKHNIQISRLHSFSYTKSKNITKLPIATYSTQLASANNDGAIIIVDIFTRRKRVIKSDMINIQSIYFLNKNWLLTTNSNEHFQIHNLKTLHSKDIHSKSIIEFLKNTKIPTLELFSFSILEPLLANKSFEQVFDLVSDNSFLKETIGYDKLAYIYEAAFKKAIQALQKENILKANQLLEKFKNVKSKKTEINALFQDFKHYDRFRLHIKEKKYAIAYAISSKHSSLTLTQEYQDIESIFNKLFQLAKSQMRLSKKDLAKETLSSYLTILSKRDQIKNLLDGSNKKDKADTDKAKLLRLYEKNNFKECYELIDKSNIENLELVELLEGHWIKLMLKCEDFALDGNIKEIKKSLGELISIKTRADKIGDILRVAFYSKINVLLKEKNFNSAQNIIYSYIDIFGEDIEIKDIMKKFEKSSSNKLALTQKQSNRESRYNWLNSELIVEY